MTYAATVHVLPSRTGGPAHWVTVLLEGPRAGATLCTCKAGQRGALCHAQRDAGAQERLNGNVQPRPEESGDPFAGLVDDDVSDIAAAIGNVSPFRQAADPFAMSQTERDALAASRRE